MRIHKSAGFFLAALTLGCSWGRFDELEENTPVVLLKRPKQVRTGFGSSLATSQTPNRVSLFVGGSPGRSTGALFDLGEEESPTLDAIGTGYCRTEGEDVCFLAAAPAPLGAASLPNLEIAPECFAVGVGATSTDQPVGVVVECEDDRGDRVGYSLAAPDAFVDELQISISEEEPELVVMAASGSDSKALIVGSARQRSAWFYATPDFGAEPLELASGREPEEDYGSTVATIQLEGERLFAVGAPEVGNVHLFLADSASATRYLGCLGGVPGFGRAMAVGPVTRGDSIPELVISDDQNVYVLSSDRLVDLGTEGEDCTLSSLPEGALYTTLGCESTPSVSGCEISDFGYALAVGDFDGDGDGEVAVGAPEMTVRGVKKAGAIVLYDAERAGDGDLAEIRFISSAETEDLLGSALAVAQIQGRQLLAASARGTGKAALFYCPDMLPNALRGARCP